MLISPGPLIRFSQIHSGHGFWLKALKQLKVGQALETKHYVTFMRSPRHIYMLYLNKAILKCPFLQGLLCILFILSKNIYIKLLIFERKK